MKEDIRCIGFSYEEAEDIMSRWNKDCVPTYEGGIVSASIGDTQVGFAQVLSDVRPELEISPSAVSIYSDMGYIYTKRGIDVIVMDGIQREA